MRVFVWSLPVALLLTGCLAAGDVPSSGEATGEEGSETRTSFEMSGITWTIACARATSLVRCQTLLPGTDLADPLPSVEGPLSLNATLEWESASPLTDRLAIGIVAITPEGLRFVPGAVASGTSPLRIDLDLREAASGDLGVHVIYYTRVGEPDANVHFSVRQDWALAGVIRSSA